MPSLALAHTISPGSYKEEKSLPRKDTGRFMSLLERLCPALSTAALPKSSVFLPSFHPLQLLFAHPKTQVMLGFQIEQLMHPHQEREPNTNNPGDNGEEA